MTFLRIFRSFQLAVAFPSIQFEAIMTDIIERITSVPTFEVESAARSLQWGLLCDRLPQGHAALARRVAADSGRQRDALGDQLRSAAVALVTPNAELRGRPLAGGPA